MTSSSRKLPDVLGLLAWLSVTAAAAVIGSIASIDAASFYAQLSRPEWAPPPFLFGPVWTVLYLLMAFAAWIVWRQQEPAGVRSALALYLMQLAANALWSWLFFGWRLGGFAFAEVLVLLALVLATLLAFRRIRSVAGWMLLPYLAWVAFASALTWAVWQRNPQLL